MELSLGHDTLKPLKYSALRYSLSIHFTDRKTEVLPHLVLVPKPGLLAYFNFYFILLEEIQPKASHIELHPVLGVGGTWVPTFLLHPVAPSCASL